MARKRVSKKSKGKKQKYSEKLRKLKQRLKIPNYTPEQAKAALKKAQRKEFETGKKFDQSKQKNPLNRKRRREMPKYNEYTGRSIKTEAELKRIINPVSEKRRIELPRYNAFTGKLIKTETDMIKYLKQKEGKRKNKKESEVLIDDIYL